VSTHKVKSPIGELTVHAYRTRFDSVLHFAFVHGSLGDGRDIPTRLHRADILNDIFGGGAIERSLKRFKEEGRGVLVYLRDGAAGVPLNISGAQSETSEDSRQTLWREVGLGAQILRDLGVTSIRLRSDSPRKFVGLAGFGVEIAKVEPIEG
jgi:3,4-dihydroxy 2-butanone 4-phosphate synthase/GTP cyclohydrolase II